MISSRPLASASARTVGCIPAPLSATVASPLIGVFFLRSHPRTVTFLTWRAVEIVAFRLDSDLPHSST